MGASICGDVAEADTQFTIFDLSGSKKQLLIIFILSLSFMNSIERFNAVMNQNLPDKIPIRVGNYNVFLTHYYGITVREYLEDPALNADLFVKLVSLIKT